MNNFERIKQMTPLELAQVLVFDEEGNERASCSVCANTNNCNDNCYEGVLHWLTKEVD